MDNEENKKTKIKFNILAIVCIIIFCFAISPVTLQNDTYYTIKIGELITQNGVDMQDHFSWNEDLPYTYPHWGYDTGMYLIYHLGEITGLPDGGMVFVYLSTIILASILGILVYFTCSKFTKNNLVSFFITLGVIYLLGVFIAARAQLLSYILFTLTILLIENYMENKKKRNLVGLVIISLIIANTHVAVWPFFFILFLPYIAEYGVYLLRELYLISTLKIFYYKVMYLVYNKTKPNDKQKLLELKEKEELARKELKANEEATIKMDQKPYKLKLEKNPAIKGLIIVMIICAFTGLFTPIREVPYIYLLKTMAGNTPANISEHLPLTLYNDKKTMTILVMFLAMLIFSDAKIKLRDLFMIGGLIFLALMSRRQVAILVLIGCHIFAKTITYILEKYDKKGTQNMMEVMTSLFGKIATILVIILISFVIYKPKTDDKFINDTTYPVEASKWILENLDIENIKLYNEYNYGSYLLFKGIPVFIDSRADLYAPEFNKTTDENGQETSRDIFSDYINISTISTYYEDKFEDYEITHIIIYRNSKLNMFLSRDDNYKQIYKDDYFVIYEREI